jgi:hypothetical protein
MPSFQIYRLREVQRQQFRWAPHASGVTEVKPRDYDKKESIEAATVYAAWNSLRDSEHQLGIGDVLEDENGRLQICKYVGFEEARWALSQPKSGNELDAVAGAGSAGITAEGPQPVGGNRTAGAKSG